MIDIAQSFQIAVGSSGIDTHQQVLQHIALIVDATGVALQVRSDDDALLVLVSPTDGISRNLVTTGETDLVLLRECCL